MSVERNKSPAEGHVEGKAPLGKIVPITEVTAQVDAAQVTDPDLSRSKAREAVARDHSRDRDPSLPLVWAESIRKAETRARQAVPEADNPHADRLGLAAMVRTGTFCECAHHHCVGSCDTRTGDGGLSCELLLPVGAPWTSHAPCRPSDRECRCRHLHCAECGIGIWEGAPPYIKPRFIGGRPRPHESESVTQEDDVEDNARDPAKPSGAYLHIVGQFCASCWSAIVAGIPEFAPSPSPSEPPTTSTNDLPVGCPSCNSNVEQTPDGRFRCAGLSANESRLRAAYDAYLQASHGGTFPKEVLPPSEGDIVRHLTEIAAMPIDYPDIPPCKWTGPTEFLIHQNWRARRPGRGRPRNGA